MLFRSAFSLWFPRNYATVSTLLVGLGATGGLMAATPLALLKEALGWRGVFLLGAFVVALVALALYLGVRNTPPGVGRAGEDEGQKEEEAQEEAQGDEDLRGDLPHEAPRQSPPKPPKQGGEGHGDHRLPPTTASATPTRRIRAPRRTRLPGSSPKRK